MSQPKIYIPKPCHENWLEMTPEQKGRFCQSCQKTVYDFTKSSDRMILEKFQSEENICGRFNTSQLDRELVIPKQKSTIWTAGIAGVLSLLNFVSDKVNAQNIPQTVQTDSKLPKNHIVGKPAVRNVAAVPKQTDAQPTQIKMGEVTAETEKKISGNVTENNMPMISVNILNKRTLVAVQTDFDGNFEVAGREKDTLEFSCIGYNNKQVIVSKSKTIAVAMQPQMLGMGEVVFVKRKSFFGRIFDNIGNIFQ